MPKKHRKEQHCDVKSMIINLCEVQPDNNVIKSKILNKSTN